ncbi:bacteriophage abortive infection AbiH family protein [Mucilaginibacter angelicae]|uniref:Bacteriophage abortive infection AbiH family protein n=1 Tax=Mucilaginibacter angelicae TaxID=869718 RepID=A0ABV6LDR3_9SPHI
MSKKILHIIGNGFDLAHGIKSSYWNFGEFVEENNKELFDTLERYFDSEMLWSDFEAALAELNTDDMVEDAMAYLQDYGAENWSESGNHDYQYELGKNIDRITKELKEAFTQWILQIEIPPTAGDNRLGIQIHELFLTFNYTPTLERVYHVDHVDIKYIHNKAIDKDSQLILGHSRNTEGTSFNNTSDLEGIDVRIYEGNQLLDEYFKVTYKPTEKIIEDNAEFFDSLTLIEEIHVIGHSMSEVDYGYFEKIVAKTDADKVRWRISYHDNKDLIKHQKAADDLGLNPAKTEHILARDFYTIQPKLF